MRPVYDELFSMPIPDIPGRCESWKLVIIAIVETAAFWNPKDIKQARDDLARVAELNLDIRATALQLAKLMRKRSKITEKRGIESPLDYDPISLFEAACRIADRHDYPDHHHRFTSWVKPELERLRDSFDLKYWPSTADMIEAVAEAQAVDAAPINYLDAAAIGGSRQGSVRDFLRALIARLGGDVESLGVPVSFSHAALATITNCALGFGEEDEITPQSIKKFSADERRR